MKICGENCHFLSNSSELDIFKYGIYHSVRSYVLKVEKQNQKNYMCQNSLSI